MLSGKDSRQAKRHLCLASVVGASRNDGAFGPSTEEAQSCPSPCRRGSAASYRPREGLRRPLGVLRFCDCCLGTDGCRQEFQLLVAAADVCQGGSDGSHSCKCRRRCSLCGPTCGNNCTTVLPSSHLGEVLPQNSDCRLDK